MVKENWTKSHVLIIDEISMVHPLLFTKLNILGQLLRQDPRPFGEFQVGFLLFRRPKPIARQQVVFS